MEGEAREERWRMGKSNYKGGVNMKENLKMRGGLAEKKQELQRGSDGSEGGARKQSKKGRG